MSVPPRLPTFPETQSCDVCGNSYPAPEVAKRGKLNFCRTCAFQQAAECLQQLQITPRKRVWPSVVATLLSLCFFGGAAWWAFKILRSQEASLAQALEVVHSPEPASPVALADASAATPRPAAVETASTENKLTPWLGRLFSGNQRSVADAGRINLLFVTRPGTDSRMGLSSLLFATREASNSEAAKLTTEVGPEMKTSFDEGLRYVRKLPRGWERDFSIRLSFEDKFTSKDGGSAGTGFTIVMLAAIQGIALDPEVAVTGDLTVDGTVQPVGGVVEKLRGAITGKCKITLIPERNARSVVDMALLDGTSPLWETQIFTIGTIDQALGLARKDRAEATQAAIARFHALRARLPANVTPNYLLSPIVQTELKEIVRAAPNHLSASTLLRAAENQLPAELSLNRSVEEILATAHLFVNSVLNPGSKSEGSSKSPGITVFPEREFSECCRTLQRLTPILDRRSLELKSACLTFAGLLRAGWNLAPPDPTARRTRAQMTDVIQREIKLRQNAKDDLDSARSRLLLAIRKLDTDGSLVSEMTKK